MQGKYGRCYVLACDEVGYKIRFQRVAAVETARKDAINGKEKIIVNQYAASYSCSSSARCRPWFVRTQTIENLVGFLRSREAQKTANAEIATAKSKRKIIINVQFAILSKQRFNYYL